MSSLSTYMQQEENMRREVYQALARAWLVAPMSNDPDLMCALAQRTRDLQDRRDLSVVSPEVEQSLDRLLERIHRTLATPRYTARPASGHVVCSRDVIIGACGAADYQAAAEVYNDVRFHRRPREYKPNGRYLLNYWGLEESTLQALSIAPGKPKMSMPYYCSTYPWPEMRTALRRWTSAMMFDLRCRP